MYHLARGSSIPKDPAAAERKSRAAKEQRPEASEFRLVVTAGTRAWDESGRGQPHSKTLRRYVGLGLRASVLECGCPLPLFLMMNRSLSLETEAGIGVEEFAARYLGAGFLHRAWGARLRSCR